MDTDIIGYVWVYRGIIAVLSHTAVTASTNATTRWEQSFTYDLGHGYRLLFVRIAPWNRPPN
jgi:hypothetical protein